MDEIEKLIRDFILRESLPGEDPNELNDETRLITGGILDSISTLKLVTFLEDHFEIRIEAYEAGVDCLDTIHQIAALVAQEKCGLKFSRRDQVRNSTSRKSSLASSIDSRRLIG